MDAYSQARLTRNRSTGAAPGQKHLDVGIVAYTRIKLADMRLSVLYGYDVIDAESVADAHRRATMNCGAYLATTREDLSFEDIKSILTRAGGDKGAVQAMDAHLRDWRYRGGHTEDEYSRISPEKRKGAR